MSADFLPLWRSVHLWVDTAVSDELGPPDWLQESSEVATAPMVHLEVYTNVACLQFDSHSLAITGTAGVFLNFHYNSRSVTHPLSLK
jgi:hypothetical protein